MAELTFEKVWEMFQETDKLIKEIAEQSRKTETLFNTQWRIYVMSLRHLSMQ